MEIRDRQLDEFIFWNSIKTNSKNTLKFMNEQLYELPEVCSYVLRFVIKMGLRTSSYYEILLNISTNNIVHLRSVLKSAIMNNHYDLAKYLFEYGISFAFEVNNLYLNNSIWFKFNDMIKLLIEKGANIHINNDCLLTYSIENNNLDLLNFLINHGININARKDYSLYLAIDNNNLNIIKCLIEHGYNFDESRKESILFYAIKHANRNIIKYLKLKANINLFEFIRLKLLSYLAF